MSIRACDYALGVAPDAGPPGGRAVLFALAMRANSNCGTTFGGQWLADAAGLDASSVRRYLNALESAGIIRLLRRPGRSHLVRFPLAGFVHNPAHQCAGCREWTRALVHATPRTGARHPAHQCAPYQEGNLEEIGARESDPVVDLDLDQVRQIWIEARDGVRAAGGSV